MNILKKIGYEWCMFDNGKGLLEEKKTCPHGYFECLNI